MIRLDSACSDIMLKCKLSSQQIQGLKATNHGTKHIKENGGPTDEISLVL